MKEFLKKCLSCVSADLIKKEQKQPQIEGPTITVQVSSGDILKSDQVKDQKKMKEMTYCNRNEDDFWRQFQEKNLFKKSEKQGKSKYLEVQQQEFPIREDTINQQHQIMRINTPQFTESARIKQKNLETNEKNIISQKTKENIKTKLNNIDNEESKKNVDIAKSKKKKGRKHKENES